MINKLLAHLDLYSSSPTPSARSYAVALPKPSKLWVIGHFMGLVAGIIAKPFVDAYQGGDIHTFNVTLPLIVFSCIVAIAIFPAVFRNSYDKENPGFVQLCVTFASGLGYQSLFTAATKATLGTT